METRDYIVLAEQSSIICINIIGLVVLTRINKRPRKLQLILLTALFTSHLVSGVSTIVSFCLAWLSVEYPLKIGGRWIEFIFVNQVNSFKQKIQILYIYRVVFLKYGMELHLTIKRLMK